jgi:hypothetical protein
MSRGFPEEAGAGREGLRADKKTPEGDHVQEKKYPRRPIHVQISR